MSSQNSKSDLVGQRANRIEKIAQLSKLGIDAYPSKATRTHTNREITDQYESLKGEVVTVVGRMMSFRDHGELRFSDLKDSSGSVQLYIKVSELEDTNSSPGVIGASDLDLLDIGDHIQATGTVTKTQKGQISVQPTSLRLLSKTVRPLPNKWTGIVDKEARFRRRYLDMTMNPEVRDRFKRRAIFWDAVREFLVDRGFHEVNIPVLEHTTGGADARPFETRYDALGENFYLRISHELPLKKLLGGGFERVFDIGPRFRNEGFSDEHLPEHIAMEWYWAYADWRDGMKMTQELFQYVLKKTYGTLQFNVKGFDIDLDGDWEEMDFADIIRERFDVDVFDDTIETLRAALVEHADYAVDPDMNRSRVADGLWKLIRKDIAGPVFLTGVPTFLSPLAKKNPDDPRRTERFHPVIVGSEMANAFTELNDPIDQMGRFLEQHQMREDGDDEAHMLDVDFVEMLEYGMPPAVGYGMTERVFWAFEGVSAREGVPFPPMRRGFDQTTKEIYRDLIDLDQLEKEMKMSAKRDLSADIRPLEPHRMSIVLDKNIEGWKMTNTVAHIAGRLGNDAGGSFLGGGTFQFEDRQIPRNSQHGIITFGAKQSQLHTFAQRLEESELDYIIYIDEMIEENTDGGVQDAINGKNLSDCVIHGIGVYGPLSEVEKLTKKFSLWR